jgi:predicted lipoprotein with Yx(FWY)xxD motif
MLCYVRAVVKTLCAALMAMSLAAAGCGGSSEGSGEAGGGASVVVTTKEFPGYGAVLANAEGRPLYVLDSDPKDGSKCIDACTQQFPPVEGSGKAEGDVDDGKLSAFKREDGGTQVSYNGHALYTNAGEALAGVGTKGQGGTWLLVSPKGEPVKTTQAGGY